MIKKLLIALLIVSMAIFFFVSCEGVSTVAVTGISLNKTSTTINTGSTETLTATVAPDNATDKTVTWTSSDTSVATVSAGTVTGVAAGTATITAKAGDYTATCEVTVSAASVAVTGISLNKTSTSIGAGGGAESLTATVTPDNATDKTVTWTSSDTSVATVSEGTVTGVAAGTATITATAGDCSATCEVSVINYNYSVGDTGPAGGKIFCVKDSYSDGWRYLEAAPNDLVLIGSTPSVDSSADGYSSGTQKFIFGYYRETADGSNLFVNGTTTYSSTDCTGTDIGTGSNNTTLLVTAMGDAAYTAYNGDSTTANYAAKLCYDLSYGGKDDWFLPSKDELNLMYELKDTIGGFADDYYWSSSEYNNSAYAAWPQYFSSGSQYSDNRFNISYVRPVRAF